MFAVDLTRPPAFLNLFQRVSLNGRLFMASIPQGWQGSGPPIFDLPGSMNELDLPPPSNSYTIACTTHYFRQRTGAVDCVVGAVVEQVYSV